ncbi:MAG TPA: ABC transporter permease, partial [Baekduia sp.]|nr:ABC transporter permease [Baekduia sp.]
MSAVPIPAAPPLAFSRLRALRPGVVLAALGVLFIVVAALVPSLLAPGSPTDVDLHSVLVSPSPDHLFGTDQAGRDLFTRVVHGARQSLAIGLGATGLSMGLALLLGGGAGLAGGKID